MQQHKRYALIALRTRRGWTQEYTADLVGVSRAVYSMIECGVRQGRLDFWQRVQQVFNLSDAEMWGLINNEKAKPETRTKIYY